MPHKKNKQQKNSKEKKLQKEHKEKRRRICKKNAAVREARKASGAVGEVT
jgi:hypothetical protein